MNLGALALVTPGAKPKILGNVPQHVTGSRVPVEALHSNARKAH